jgi:hypothetical protein
MLEIEIVRLAKHGRDGSDEQGLVHRKQDRSEAAAFPSRDIHGVVPQCWFNSGRQKGSLDSLQSALSRHGRPY